MVDSSTAAPAPRWLPAVTLALSLLGLGISVYLTVEHYSGNHSLACPNTGTVNCLKVTTGPYSSIVGLPVAVYGLAFFVAMLAFMSPPLWRSPVMLVHRLRLVAVTAGMAMVLWLVYVELFKADAICLWCTGVHAITFLLFGLVLLFGLRPVAAE